MVAITQISTITSWSDPFLWILVLLSIGSVKWWKQCYVFLVNHKRLITLVAVALQVLFLISSELLIRRDAAVVFQGAFRIISDQSISNYLTRNPNNLSLFLYERFFYNMFGFSSLWILQGVNMLCTNATAWILYRGTSRHFGSQVGNAIFILYVGLLGFSPYFYSMYTDILPLPFIALQLIFALDILASHDRVQVVKKSLLLAGISALAIVIRPTTFIVLIAFLMTLLFKGNWKKTGLVFLHIGIPFVLAVGSLNWFIDRQEEVTLIEGQGLAKGPLLFVNLGLTSTGHDQEDMKEGLLQYIEPEKRSEYNNGMFLRENVVKEIKRRLGQYTLFSFVNHLIEKQELTVSEGTLGWPYRDIDNEKTPVLNPLYRYTKHWGISSWIRKYFLSIDKSEYRYYALVKQFLWIVMAVGLVLVFLRFKLSDSLNFLSLAVFGGLLFLLIFEGGKTRYLIQFLPQVLILAGLGLTGLTKKPKGFWKEELEG
ncbi:membrane protein [Streptococcus sp. DD13]|nr:membrane protein [Streptococcus sp. DD13]